MLERMTGWDRGQRVARSELRVVEARHVGNPVRDLARLVVLSSLQVGVLQVIHGVQRVERGRSREGPSDPRLRRPGRGDVRVDRLLPHPQAGEDVRGHVQRVRRRGRNLGVRARRRQRHLGEFGVVERVDHVMGDPGMLGFNRQEAIEDRRRLLLPRVGLVGRRVVGHAEDREGMEDVRLVVVGVALRHASHRLLVGHHSCWMRHAVPTVVGPDRGDVIAFAGGPCACLRRLLRRCTAGGEFVRRGWTPDLVEVAHCDPPLRHAASGILRRHFAEDFGDLAVRERVQQCHSALERRLDRRIARSGEVDLAELLRRGMRVIVLVLREDPPRRQGKRGRQNRADTERRHGPPFVRQAPLSARTTHDGKWRS